MTKITKLRGPYKTQAMYFDGGHDRSVIVTLTPAGVLVRLHRQKDSRFLPYGVLYQYAAQLAALSVPRVTRGKV